MRRAHQNFSSSIYHCPANAMIWLHCYHITWLVIVLWFFCQFLLFSALLGQTFTTLRWRSSVIFTSWAVLGRITITHAFMQEDIFIVHCSPQTHKPNTLSTPLVHASPTMTPGPSQPTPMSLPLCQKPITPTPDPMQWLLAIHLLTLTHQHSNAERPFSHTMWSLVIWWCRDRLWLCRGRQHRILNLVSVTYSIRSVMLVVVWTADFRFCVQISDPSHEVYNDGGLYDRSNWAWGGRNKVGLFFHFNCLTNSITTTQPNIKLKASLVYWTCVNIF